MQARLDRYQTLDKEATVLLSIKVYMSVSATRVTLCRTLFSEQACEFPWRICRGWCLKDDSESLEVQGGSEQPSSSIQQMRRQCLMFGSGNISSIHDELTRRTGLFLLFLDASDIACCIQSYQLKSTEWARLRQVSATVNAAKPKPAVEMPLFHATHPAIVAALTTNV